MTELCVQLEPELGMTYDDILAAARVADATGWSGLFLADHYMSPSTIGGPPGPVDAWVTLAGLARETANLRLGTLVTPCGFRHPTNLAIMVAEIDAMSGGRIELGLGVGHSEREHRGTASRSGRSGRASTCWRSSSPSSPACGRHRRARRSIIAARATHSRSAPRCPSRSSARTLR